MKPFLVEGKHLLILHIQYHGWCPGSLRHQGISSHDIDLNRVLAPHGLKPWSLMDVKKCWWVWLLPDVDGDDNIRGWFPIISPHWMTNVLPQYTMWHGQKTCSQTYPLTHWGWVAHIFISKLTIIVSDNCLSPGRRQAIIWTNTGISRTLGTNFTEILIAIHTFSFKKMHFNISSAKWRPFCLSLNVLTHITLNFFKAKL